MNKSKKSIAIVGTNGLPGRYGGWDQLMNHLTIQLQEDYKFAVYTSSHDRVEGIEEVNGAHLEIVYLQANGFQSVVYDGWSMLHACFKYDTLLVLGTSGCIFLPFIKLFRKKIVLNPDGAEWKRGKWNKAIKWFLKLSEYIGVKFADVVITDNVVIQEYVAKEYQVDSILIEYGGDNAKAVPLSPETAAQYDIELPANYAFKVCRIEPENNVDLILNAFSQTDFPLVFVGNWNRSAYGKNVREKYRHNKNMKLLDAIYDQEQLDSLRSNCSLYVHGHSVGGTNPSLVEAMNLGLACIVFDVDYNRETTENKAIYFNDVQGLLSQIDSLRADPSLAEAVKEDMLKISKSRYQWRTIVEKYATTF